MVNMNINFKKILSILLILLVVLINFSCVGMKNSVKIHSTEPAELPVWINGNEWIYDMKFNFKTSIFEVNADISELSAKVDGTEMLNGKEQYKLEIDSDTNSLTGTVKIAFLDGPEIKGRMTGNAYIEKATLGMTKFDFRVDGEVKYLGKWHDLVFVMVMTFTPCFDFFDFTIDPSEEPWNIHIDEARIDASVDIDIRDGKTIHKETSESDSFDDEITLKDIKDVNYGGDIGECQTFVLGGDWGLTSDLYYVPELGFLAQVKETLDINGVVAYFDLNLLETNYNSENKPPNQPVITSGVHEGDEEEEYSFTAVSTDDDGDQIDYFFDWGDGTNSGWIENYNSGNPCTQFHSWLDKGTYNILVKTRDQDGLESPYSDPYSITIIGNPSIFVTINKIQMKDAIDILSEAELYYEIIAESEDNKIQTKYDHNTNTGLYSDNFLDWFAANTWEPNKVHEFEIDTRKTYISIKVMDYDGPIEFGNDDLADISGCNHPDTDGEDDIEETSRKYKRGAIFRQTYDLVLDDLEFYSNDHGENHDYYSDSDSIGEYITCGDYKPDNSTRYEGEIGDPENDAKVWFTIDTDYRKPEVTAEIIDLPDKIRPNIELKFKGSVTNGAPSYEWLWDFGDGVTSSKQNPMHSYQNVGTYTVTLTVTDGFEQTDSYSFTIKVAGNNKPSNLIINGPASGEKGETYSYDFSAEDDDLDELEYHIDWGDGNTIDWFGPHQSGEKVTKTHLWENKGTYTITFKVKDEYGAISTELLPVSMPKGKSHALMNLYNIFQKLTEITFFNKLFDLYFF